MLAGARNSPGMPDIYGINTSSYIHPFVLYTPELFELAGLPTYACSEEIGPAIVSRPPSRHLQMIVREQRCQSEGDRRNSHPVYVRLVINTLLG